MDKDDQATEELLNERLTQSEWFGLVIAFAPTGFFFALVALGHLSRMI